ncbi:MAG: hypothetical protein B7C24_05670 [Bacteroidetes bacterium 4572_77]|nr:MAG: hypothetical protein B7C24_05670 [Bacteroidetes bacterium 4572_77]
MNYNINAPSCIVDTSHFSCLDYLNEEEVALLNKNKREVSFKKGEIIVKQGSFASHVIFLKKGLAKIYIEGNQKDLILKIVPSNHFVSLSSVYDGNACFVYSATAYVESVATLISIDVFKQLIRNNAEFAMQIINILNTNTRQIYGRFYCISQKQSHGRVADILLCLSENVFKSEEFRLNISRNDLADLTGLSSESVIRIFKSFKNEKLIEVDGRNIKVLEPDKLKDISIYG